MKYEAVNKKIDYLKSLISVMPDTPGIYQYFDSDEKIIYVGKAKNLKKRVASYFTKKHEHRKTALLVRNIADIKYMIVETEEDALLLENNLIKKYQPRYNIRLKDDKTYPWICIKNERFPRVFKTRNIVRDGSKYFGPYTSYVIANTLLDLFRSAYKLRNCNYNLSAENVKNGKYKLCLEHHIGNCWGPCENQVDEEKYNQNITEITDILKGNVTSVIAYLRKIMKNYSRQYAFEEAQNIKEKLVSLEKYRSKSTIVSTTITDVDVFSFVEDEKYAYVNYLKVIKGAIIQTHTMELKKGIEEKKEDLLLIAIVEIRQKIFSNAKEILIPFRLDQVLKNVTFFIPQRGQKKHLLDLSTRNAKYYRLEKEKKQVLANPKIRTDRVLERIKKDLQIKKLPKRIECFDNSNLQGSNPVASCVVFINGKPQKREYRHYNIKTVTGPDDFASMEEVVFRRYKRLLEEEKSLPQLIVIDGGKGQLNSAVNALERLKLRGQISIIGIAKKLEELYFPRDSIALYLDKNSETLKVIQKLRDEAHRFGIAFHRQKRSKKFIVSELENIKGIGPKTIQKLLKKYKSVLNIKKLPFNELVKDTGKAKATLISNYFNQK